MPTGRLTLRRIGDVLRLKFAQGLSERAIAAPPGFGKGSAGTCLRRAREAGLSGPPPKGRGDGSLELLLFPASPTVPDPDRPIGPPDIEPGMAGAVLGQLLQRGLDHRQGELGPLCRGIEVDRECFGRVAVFFQVVLELLRDGFGVFIRMARFQKGIEGLLTSGWLEVLRDLVTPNASMMT